MSDSQDESRDQTVAAREAWRQMSAAIQRLPEDERLGRSRKLVAVRCGAHGCGLELGTVTATRGGWLFRSALRARPWDSNRPGTEMVDKAGTPAFEWDDTSWENNDPENHELDYLDPTPDFEDGVCEDLLEFKPSSLAPWHPELLVRCPKHPNPIKSLDRDHLLGILRRQARRRKPFNLIV